MTREEAIAILQEKYDYCKSFYDLAAHPEEDYPEMEKYLQALQIALSALQTENAQLRGELEYEQEHANAYYEECGQWEAENEKLRVELEQVKAERDAAVKCIEEIEDALNFQRMSAIGLRISEWRGQKED